MPATRPRFPTALRFPLPVVTLALAVASLLAVGCRAQAPATPASVRDDFRKLVIADRKPSPLNPRAVSQSDVGNVRVERVKITPETGFDAVVALYRPKAEGKYPTVIIQHFLGGSKDHLALIPLMNGLAQRGYVVAAIDGRFRGERQNGTSLDAAIAEALKTGKGHPFLFDTAYDLTRLLDYLQSRPDVDGDRIGMTGLSEGGILTWMTAVLDDRIKVAVPIIGVTTFSDAFEDKETPETQTRIRLFEPALREHAKAIGEPAVNAKVFRSAWQRLLPGTLDRFDAPNLVPLVAPRPLLILNHGADELFPVEGAKKVFEKTKARYAELKAEEKLSFQILPDAKHAAFNFGEINAAMAWMDKWLKNPPAGQ